ncbi:MAG: hypothetical protein SWK76_04585 [Actinomycetota bacterium]|nr:hypothetical protein [Actinomycetota bacterium]
MGFVKDIRRCPGELTEAAAALVPAYVYLCKAVCRVLGVKRAIIDVHRSSNDFISPPDTFRELSFPSLKLLVEMLAAEGIDSVLHLNGNRDLNLEILRGLPAGRVVANSTAPRISSVPRRSSATASAYTVMSRSVCWPWASRPRWTSTATA